MTQTSKSYKPTHGGYPGTVDEQSESKPRHAAVDEFLAAYAARHQHDSLLGSCPRCTPRVYARHSAKHRKDYA